MERNYRELIIRGEQICAYPCCGIPDAMWKIYPVRGWRFGRIMRVVSILRLDRVLLRRVGFPLEKYGLSEKTLTDAIFKWTECESVKIAFAWPAPIRSSDRFYGYVLTADDGRLVAYIKLATSREEDKKLLREYSTVGDVASRFDKVSFSYPKTIGAIPFDGCISIYAYQPLPLEAPRYVRWSADSWERDILPIKNEISDGTHRHLSKDDAYSLDWVRRFLTKATPAQMENLSRALEHGMDVCATHGDMACQNFRRHEGRYWLFDWEEFTMDGPVRADELSFKLSSSVYGMGKSFQEAMPVMPQHELITAAAFQVANGLSFKKELGELLDKRII